MEIENIIEYPIVEIDNFSHDEKVLIVHSHINMKGKMVLTKDDASLLLIELYKFITN